MRTIENLKQAKVRLEHACARLQGYGMTAADAKAQWIMQCAIVDIQSEIDAYFTLVHAWRYLRKQRSVFSPIQEQQDVADAMSILGALIVDLQQTGR